MRVQPYFRKIAVLVLSVFLVSCHGNQAYIDIQGAGRLHAYTNQDRLAFARLADEQAIASGSLRRNTSGTQLRLAVEIKGRAYLLSSDVAGRTTLEESSCDSRWCNNEGKPVVCYDDDKREFRFSNGSSLPAAFVNRTYPDGSTHEQRGYCGVSDSGSYFWLERQDSLEVYGSTRLENPIASLKHQLGQIHCLPMRTYVYDTENQVYVVRIGTQPYKKKKEMRFYYVVTNRINIKDGNAELGEETVSLFPTGLRSVGPWLREMDPDAGLVAFRDWNDPPFGFLDTWYLLDLNTNTWKKIGLGHATQVLFLKGDILRNAIAAAGRKAGASTL